MILILISTSIIYIKYTIYTIYSIYRDENKGEKT